MLKTTFYEPPTPTLARRMGCWLYEALLLAAIFMGWVVIQSLLALAVPALNHPLLLQLGAMGVFALYCVGFWTGPTAQTLPMKTWGIRVLDAQGRRLGRLRALVRFALAWVWVAPFGLQLTSAALGWGAMTALWLLWVAAWALLAKLHPSGQFWHDALAGTRLVALERSAAKSPSAKP